MSSSKCEKWFAEHHRTLLWLLFIVSMYYVCVLKLKSNNERGEPQTVLAFVGSRNIRSQALESDGAKPKDINSLNRALRLIPVFQHHQDVEREKLEGEAPVNRDLLVHTHEHVGHGSTIFRNGISSGHVISPNRFAKLIRFLTPAPVPCRIPTSSIVETVPPFGGGIYTNGVKNNRCHGSQPSVYTSHALPRKMPTERWANSLLSRTSPNSVQEELSDPPTTSGGHIDLYVDESLSFLNQIRELRAELLRDMELNIHMNFSGLNTFRKHGIIGRFLQSARQALQQHVLVRSSLQAAEMGRLLNREAVGSPAAITLTTSWQRRGSSIRKDTLKKDPRNY